MKLLSIVAGSLCLCALPAHAQSNASRLSPPVNVVVAPNTPTPTATAAPVEHQAMVIEEDGTVRFLSPQEAADLFLPDPAASRFEVELEQPAAGSDSLRIEVTGAEITDSVSADGLTRILRIRPKDGSPGRLITITKD